MTTDQIKASFFLWMQGDCKLHLVPKEPDPRDQDFEAMDSMAASLDAPRVSKPWAIGSK